MFIEKIENWAVKFKAIVFFAFIIQIALIVLINFRFIDFSWWAVIFELLTVPVITYFLALLVMRKFKMSIKIKKVFSIIFWSYFVLFGAFFLIADNSVLPGFFTNTSYVLVQALAFPSIVIGAVLYKFIPYYVLLAFCAWAVAPVIWATGIALIYWAIKLRTKKHDQVK
jgi:hypothetical protein